MAQGEFFLNLRSLSFKLFVVTEICDPSQILSMTPWKRVK